MRRSRVWVLVMPMLTSRGFSAAFGATLATVVLLAIPAQSSAYKTIGGKWPKGRITYYNGIKGYDPAVKAAVKAWNKSGAKVRFKRVSKKKAGVKIRYLPDNTCRGLTRLPSTRRIRKATVYLPSPSAPEYCRDKLTMTIIVAHEFGHVLGLGHETRRCALMNPAGNRTGGSLCAEAGGTPPWLWRCRIIEPDDLRGAIRIYGGKYRSSKFKSSPLCDVYPPPPAAAIVSATDSGAGNMIDLTIRRPADGVVPPFLLNQFQGGVAPFVYVAYAAGTCPSVPSADAIAWGSTPVGGTLGLSTRSSLAPGRYCVSVWAADAIGRPSAPTSAPVDII